MITPSVVHYLVSCVLLGQLCTTRSVVYIIRSVVCFSVSCLFSISCALLNHAVVHLILAGQLHITRSIVYYSASCESRLVGCMMTLSVVYQYSVSSVTLSPLYDNSVSCALLGQLYTTCSVVCFFPSVVCFRSVVHYSVGCVLPRQLCYTRSLV